MANEKSWIPKVLLGCGALVFLGIIAVVAAGYLGYRTVKSKTKGFDPNTMAKQLESAAKKQAAKAGNTAPSGSTPGSSGSSDPFDHPNVTPAALRKALQQPLTRKDLTETKAILDEVEASQAYKDYRKSADSLKKSANDKNAGTMKQLAQMRDVTRGIGAMKDLQIELDKAIKKHGGYQAYFDRMTRLGGAASAAQAVAKDHNIADPSSDEVADLIPKDAPGVKKEFDKTEAEAQKLQKAGKPQNAQMMMMSLLQPGPIGMARMPPASFKAWRSFSVADRKLMLDPMHGLGHDIPTLLFLAATPQALVVESQLDLWKK